MNQDHNPHWTPAEDLEWSAFRYVANELSEAETAAFELRLADDQAAREAVARCVQLTHSVMALEEARATLPTPAPTPVATATGRHRLRWFVAAALAAAATVCGAFWIGTEFAKPDAVDPDGSSVASQKPVKTPTTIKPATVDPSAVIAAWLNFDAANVLDSGSSADATTALEEPAKSSTPAPAEDGSFNWVVAAVDDAPLAAPVPDKTAKEPKR